MPLPPVSLDFADWLRRLRRAHDLTQEVLAEKVGCAVHTLRSFEAGRRRPSRDLAARLATVLDLPADQRDRFVRLARRGPSEDEAAPAPPLPARAAALLATKLFTPPPPPHMVERRQLIENLSARPARLTLIVAPPGFGKSTLLAALPRPGRP